MDTSKQYVKMCDKSNLDETCSYPMPGFLGGAMYVGDDVFVELDRGTATWRTVRLLRQSQIQEMMPPCNCVVCLTAQLHRFVDNNIEGLYQNEVDTMEQLWLVFYMFKAHHKYWDGKQWVKSEKK